MNRAPCNATTVIILFCVQAQTFAQQNTKELRNKSVPHSSRTLINIMREYLF